MANLKLMLAQVNIKVGDIKNNLKKHLEVINYAEVENVDLIIFPELSLVGYSAEDLLLRPHFINEVNHALIKLTKEVKNTYCLVGHPVIVNNKCYNAISLIHQGKIVNHYHKHYLPNYEVFDEARYFEIGSEPCVTIIKGIPVGLIICEDLWYKKPVQHAVARGAKLIVVANASPYETTKAERRLNILKTQATDYRVPIAYVNLIGGQDDLVFDGGSMLMNDNGNVQSFAGYFNEQLLITHLNEQNTCALTLTEEDSVYQALTLGLKDYINKNNISGALIGLSGGIDSALTAAIAVDALGKERVRGVYMPSRYSSNISEEEAYTLAKNLDIAIETISIDNVYNTFLKTLSPCFKDEKVGVTEENIQARCRATILMALSNHFGYLVLNTGNRSELAVGYCTLYGDMAGGFAVLKNVPKTFVYKLAHYRNNIQPVIPKRTINRAPSAELKPDQKDQDSLPPYDILDKILENYIDKSLSAAEIIAEGFEEALVKHILYLVKKNQYKRQQAPIGVHLTPKSFGKAWRYPLTNGFEE